MNKNSKIYVAGHSGLVGSAIVRCLKACGYENIITRSSGLLNLVKQDSVDEFFNAQKPEYVFLAAAKVGGILANGTYPADFIYENIMMGANIVHASYKYGVQKLLNLGSSCIYPKFAPQPMKEDSILTSELEPTNEAYSIAKIAVIKLCRYYNQQYGTNFISIMPTNQYGENDNFNMETAHVLPMLIRRFYLAKLLQSDDFEGIKKDLQKYPLGYGLDFEKIIYQDNEKIANVLATLGAYRDRVVIWGNGLVYRELMNSCDLANACVYLMEYKDHKDIGEFVNITSGSDILMKDLVEIVKKIVGFEGKIEYDGTKPNGMPRKLMDDTKIRSLGWRPQISLTEGIGSYYKWYVES
ncbi:MAG: GDP-L-fucose synthase [Holosporaceae bacterium]|jgi:GDP-L-fucose synthase|nr:GDP-L-fucose synthase [Holosporaceae bacterium]